MKKIIALLLSVVMLLTLCACGAAEVSEEEPAPEEVSVEEVPAESPAESASAAFEPVTFAFAEASVTVLGAEEFYDAEQMPAVRFYYDYTNNSDAPTSAWWTLNFSAAQGECELSSTYADAEFDVAEYGNSSLRVYPGVTIRCIEEFSYDPEEGGVITLTVDDYADEYTAEIDTAALTGRPAEELSAETIAEPTLTAGMDTAGEGSGYAVSIVSAEVTDGWDEKPVVRVYFDYTNNSSEAESCWEALPVYVFQDGIQLEAQWASENSDEDNAYKETVAPGSAVRCSNCWELRSDSPVEVYIKDNSTGTVLGASFPVA